MPPLRVLIVEDSENDTLLLVHTLRRAGFDPIFERVDTPDAMARALTSSSWDIVISDYTMPRFDGVSALRVLKQQELDVPFILVSGSIGEELAVAAMKAGAHDYVMKDNLQRLGSAITRELREAEIRREHKRSEERLRYLARYDPLTGLPNRNFLYDRLADELLSRERKGEPVALMILNFDHFREINNTMGHQTGDLLLQQVAPRLQKDVGGCEAIARLAGDQFAIVLPAADERAAVLAAEAVLRSLESPFLIGDLTLAAGASIGIAVFPKHAADPDMLLRRADVALHLAKEAGSSYTVYAPERDSYSPERLALMAELHHGITGGQLFLNYQPKLDLRTGRISGVEALARWRHPKRGLIPPDQFIPMAERTGSIKSLTMWAIRTALMQSKSWCEQGFDVPVAVNLSVRTLQDPTFPDQMINLLENSQVKPDQLELEITESSIMSDPLHTIDILRRIHDLGIELSIDDFGTGYSSLSYLRKLPVGSVKIDQSFVRELMIDENQAVIVRATIDLGRNLGLRVIAEGVENRSVLDRLASWGCDQAQGYFISKPLSDQGLTNFLTERSLASTNSQQLCF